MDPCGLNETGKLCLARLIKLQAVNGLFYENLFLPVYVYADMRACVCPKLPQG